MKIIPSIASANLLALGEEIDRLGSIGCLHLDIEDGNFLPSMTFGMDMVRAIAGHTRAELDAHLMVTRPLDYVEPLHACGVQRVAGHIEALPYPATFLGKVKSLGMKAGLALNLKTGIDELLPFLPQLDYVLFLTSEPDHAGMMFREFCFTRLSEARKLLPATIEIWADGGVNGELLPSLLKCGVDTVIMGRGIFNNAAPEAEYRRLMDSLQRK